MKKYLVLSILILVISFYGYLIYKENNINILVNGFREWIIELLG